MIAGATQAGDLGERRRKPRRAIEVRVVLDTVEITKRRKREIEVEEHLVDAVFGVEKIESFVVVRDGPDNQVPVRWKVSYCCVVFADNLKTTRVIGTGVLELPAFYM
jgi:hypothetical protein